MNIIQFPLNHPSQPVPGLPLLRLGFRPFYLGGAAFGVIAVALWLLSLHGWQTAGRMGAINSEIWHVHEMIFGFVAAIVTGFLLTAVRAWTSLNTPRGAPLAALWLLWVAGRVLVWTGPEPLAAVVDVAFLPAVAVALARVLIAAHNRRNLFLAAVLFLLGILNAFFHWWAWHGWGDAALHTAYAAIGFVLMFVTVIGGRVIPMFTMNAIPGFTVRRFTLIERLAAPLVVITLLADALGAPAALVAICAAGTAVVHAVRLWGWCSWRVGPRPILWILHVAALWLPVGFAMLAFAALGRVPHTLAIHALTVGAMGCAIIAMITRTALGHTGRALVAGPYEKAAYGLMIVAALLRVVAPLVVVSMTPRWLDAAAVCWCAALVAYLLRYAGYLTSARIDGKDG